MARTNSIRGHEEVHTEEFYYGHARYFFSSQFDLCRLWENKPTSLVHENLFRLLVTQRDKKVYHLLLARHALSQIHTPVLSSIRFMVLFKGLFRQKCTFGLF